MRQLMWECFKNTNSYYANSIEIFFIACFRVHRRNWVGVRKKGRGWKREGGKRKKICREKDKPCWVSLSHTLCHTHTCMIKIMEKIMHEASGSFECVCVRVRERDRVGCGWGVKDHQVQKCPWLRVLSLYVSRSFSSAFCEWVFKKM